MGPCIRVTYASSRTAWLTKLLARLIAFVASVCLVAFSAMNITILNDNHGEHNSFVYMPTIIGECLVRPQLF